MVTSDWLNGVFEEVDREAADFARWQYQRSRKQGKPESVKQEPQQQGAEVHIRQALAAYTENETRPLAKEVGKVTGQLQREVNELREEINQLRAEMKGLRTGEESNNVVEPNWRGKRDAAA